MTSRPITYTVAYKVISKITRTIVSQLDIDFALDSLSVLSAAAYSLRKLRVGYTGNAIRVRRSSDSAELDIGFTAGGDLDTTALLNHTSFDTGRAWDAGVLVESGAGLRGITKLSNGNVLAVGYSTNRVYQSTDNGQNWSIIATISGAGLVGITQLSNGDVLAVGYLTNRVYRSTDNGGTWDAGVLISGAALRDITQLSNGDVLAVGGSNRVYRSTDNGGTWDAGVLVASGAGLIGITQLSNGDVLAVGYLTNQVYRSTDNGGTWDAGVLVASGAGLVGITQLSNGDVLAVGGSNRVYRSTPTGFITTWYDQSGNTGRNAVQATAANQPLIVRGGAVVTQNGKPAVSFIGADSDVLSATIPSLTTHSINLVTTSTISGTDLGILTYSAGNLNQGITHDAGSNIKSYFGGSSDSVTRPLALNTPAVISRTWDGTADINNANLFTQGVASTTKAGTPASTGATTTLSIGRATNFATQLMQEFIVYPSALSTPDRQILERNQGVYFSISVA